MKKDKRRYLSYYSPEIVGKKELPVNFEFAQFYTMDEVKEPDHHNPPMPFDELFLGIEITDYQTRRFGIFSTLGKPISKIIR